MSHDILRRMVSPPPPAPEDVPITSSRAMRLAVTRAADKTHDLSLSVTGLWEETAGLEAMLAMIGPDQMLVSMMEGNGMVGLAALDMQTRAALIEIQTIGKVLAETPEDRPATRTDVSMSQPLLRAILSHLTETAPRTPLEGWGQGVTPDGQIANARAAGLILPERSYRVIRISLDFQLSDRQGTLMLALPDHLEAAVDLPPATNADDWTESFQTVVNTAPVRLRAILHRFSVPLYVAEDLKVGQVLPLPGCQVTSVKLLAADGRKVATARLGQSGGMRAIRVEPVAAPDLEALEKFGGQETPAAGADTMDIDAIMATDGDMADLDGAINPMSADDHDFAAATAADEEGEDETMQMLDDLEAALSHDAGGGGSSEDFENLGGA